MIRRMRSSDLLAAAQLEKELFGSSPWDLTMLERELTGPDRVYVVWQGPMPSVLAANPRSFNPGAIAHEHEVDEFHQSPHASILGYGGIWVGGPVAQVMTIGVTRHAQGHGIGRAIMDALIDAAQSHRCQRIELQVRTDNSRAQKLYRRMGFQVCTTIPHYYQPENVDAFVMDRECASHGTESFRKDR
jgi:ribosomal-protein-alanine N-acetyltransferase